MIKLTDTLYLSADHNQYIIGKPRQRRGEAGGRVELAETQYFITMASALSAALSRTMRAKVESGEVDSLQAFLVQQQQTIDQFTALVGPLDGRYTVVQGGGTA